MRDFFGSIGASAGFLFSGIARLGGLLVDSVRLSLFPGSAKRALRTDAVFHQMMLSGVDSIPIICLVGASMGMVLALQGAYQLKQFGAVMYTGSLVSVSVARELGPLMAAIVIAGRIGARMAAELGTMKVQEEVDALTTMGLEPIRFLVVPRCLSLCFMLPCLVILMDVVAMIGGFAIGVLSVGITPDLYIAKSFDALVLKDIYTGLAKSFLFAGLIGLVSCHEGLSVEGGAHEVGHATTQAVVTSIVLIIVVDCLATAIFYYALPS